MDDFTRYIPHTEEDIQTMLEFAGAKKVEDLFEMIPKETRLSKPLNLPEPLSEPDLLRYLQGLQSATDSSFLGAGAYHHFYPFCHSCSDFSVRILHSLHSLSTRDQPGDAPGDLEISNVGVSVDGMEVSNASMYDGRLQFSRGGMDGRASHKTKKILLSEAVHPEYRKVIQTYIDPERQELIPIPLGKTRVGQMKDDYPIFSMGKWSGVVIQSPNFFGVIEDLHLMADQIHEAGG